MSRIQNLVRADRTGDFMLYIKTIRELLPIFLGCDGINYLRNGTFFWVLLKNLKHMHKDLYSSFSNGDFVVKTKSGTFNAVSPDMKLEQTIQRSAKSSKGIIGQSKKIDYFTEWGLVYHEIIEITNAFYDMTNANKFGNTENRIHHELYGSTAFRENKHIENLVDLINSHCNP